MIDYDPRDPSAPWNQSATEYGSDPYRKQVIYERDTQRARYQLWERCYEHTPGVRETDYFITRNGQYVQDERDRDQAKDLMHRLMAGDEH